MRMPSGMLKVYHKRKSDCNTVACVIHVIHCDVFSRGNPSIWQTAQYFGVYRDQKFQDGHRELPPNRTIDHAVFNVSGHI
jgi:hypothetical protein